MHIIHTSLAAILLFFFSGCASIHSGNYATEEVRSETTPPNRQGVEPTASPDEPEKDLIISGSEVVPLSSTYLGILDFTFENTTSQWMRIQKVSIDFGDPTVNDEVQVPVGSDIVVWYEAAQQKVDISNYNMQMILGAIAGAGGIAAGIGSANNKPGLAAFGAMNLVAAASVSAFAQIETTLRELETSKIVPRNHLFSQDFIIPPGLHTKKWILLYTQNPVDIPYLSSIFITLGFDNGEERKVKVNFRSCLGGFSKWQGKHTQIPSDSDCNKMGEISRIPGSGHNVGW